MLGREPLRVWLVEGLVTVNDSSGFAIGDRVVVAGGDLKWRIQEVPSATQIRVRRWRWTDTVIVLAKKWIRRVIEWTLGRP